MQFYLKVRNKASYKNAFVVFVLTVVHWEMLCFHYNISWRKSKQVCCATGSIKPGFCRCLPHLSPGKVPFLKSGDFFYGDLRVVRKVGIEDHKFILIMDFYTYQYNTSSVQISRNDSTVVSLGIFGGFFC